LSESVTLQGLHKTATNGFIKYVKSKQTAAHESYRRAKELMASKAFEEPHIFLSKYINDDEQKRLEMVNLISNFRPSETIFEVGRRGTRNLTEAAVAMMNYRTRSDSYIAKTKAKRESQPDPLARFDSDGEDEEVRAASAAPSKYRDDDFYIPHVKPDANTEKGYSMTKGGSFAEQVQDAVLTIAGDDIDDLRRKQNALRWDSKKKKFVKGLGIGSDNKKLITGESGVKLPASFKSGTFD
ncbi:ATP-dependent RNA helicase dbp10, partial [Spiromyces aspiralis]